MRHVRDYASMVSTPDDLDFVLVNLLKEFLESPRQSAHVYRSWHQDVWKDGLPVLTPRTSRYSFKDFKKDCRTARDLSPSTLPILAMCCFGLKTTLLDWWKSPEIF
ncbi:uncharacterized protein BP01DRAFT_227707 [Aspergillus saccharolyticus JOP 1030-1]|uniref:Uncharacterized protein n=1 Tax=Aspergillus saccharolyticus JOP 1030-1 TaxID=1450539 RepID=A0A318ZT71_9EURO|nr:hypothetical protein BP01DRAFT_227707 [Aspergillus saccharolyticus JOP 1030-1]PYH47160.1 hypothetical protein BP01DRAFT_227707 [Aspergillus saccharolyticus JOP 1030-1]